MDLHKNIPENSESEDYEWTMNELIELLYAKLLILMLLLLPQM